MTAEQIQQKINMLVDFTLTTMFKYSEGKIDDNQFRMMLESIDVQQNEIEAEIAVFKLLNDICLN